MRKTFLPLTLMATISFSLIAIPVQAEESAKKSSMKLIKTINGSIAPKSVRASNDGIVSAHNMMYKHSVTIYDAKTFELIKTIPDSVSLKDFGFSKNSSIFRGSPVEGSFHPMVNSCTLATTQCMVLDTVRKEAILAHRHLVLTAVLSIELIVVIIK